MVTYGLKPGYWYFYRSDACQMINQGDPKTSQADLTTDVNILTTFSAFTSPALYSSDAQNKIKFNKLVCKL